jgi:antitoxin component YwqK of YwqJK toxin-antitoxin module
MCRIALWIAVCLFATLVDPRLATAEEFHCPSGALVHGEPPPQGTKAWCELPDGTQHGPSLSWYEEGKPKAEAHFDQGKLQGVFKLWHTNGQLAEEGNYIADQRHGTFSTWGEDGVKLLEQNFLNGKRNGEIKRWHRNGQLQFFEHYVDGEKDGPAVAYFENGQKEAEGMFRKGNFHGTWTGWYPDGKKRKVAEFVDGDRISAETFPDE